MTCVLLLSCGVNDFILVLGLFLGTLGLPGNSGCLDHDFILESREFGVEIRQIQPGDAIFVEHFEPENIVPCDGKILL
jgi:hypothetical protein